MQYLQALGVHDPLKPVTLLKVTMGLTSSCVKPEAVMGTE